MRTAILAACVACTLCHRAAGQEACEAQRVTAPPAIETTDFGLAVATNGRFWFVASPKAHTLCSGSPFACSTGAVFAFEDVGGQLVYRQTIVPPDIQLADNFGISIDVDGDRLVVGSLYTRWPGSDERPGAVYTYRLEGRNWVEDERIRPPAEVVREFGGSVALHGGTLIIHEFRQDRFWVYRETSGGWELVQSVLPSEPLPPPPAQGFFGYEWAFNGDWCITSAPGDRSIAAEGGSLHFYRRRPDGTLSFEQRIAATEPMYLGISLDFTGDTLVVGAPYASRHARFQGVVQLYEFDGERWALQDELTHSNPAENHQFGNRVLAHDGRLFVSTFNERTSDAGGSVHSFERDASGQWLQTRRWEPSPVEYAGHYGIALAASGQRLMVSARQDEAVGGGVVGAAYFFDLDCTACRPDLDANGSLTVFDFLLFLNLFQDADPLADFDGDGELTIFDFLAFQTAFDAGCA